MQTTATVIKATLLWDGSPLEVTYTRTHATYPNARFYVDDLGLTTQTQHATPPTEEIASKDHNGKLTLLTTRVEIGNAVLELALVPDDVEKMPRSRFDRRMLKGVFLGAMIHASILTVAFIGRAGVGEDDSQATIMRYQASIDDRAAMREELKEPPVVPTDSSPIKNANAGGVASSMAKKGQAGAAGNPTRSNDNGVAMQAHGSDTHGRSTDSSPESLETFGMLAILAGDAHGSANAGRSIFADYEGPSAMGNIFGSTIDDAAGMGGLAVSGVGEGGGGQGKGVPLSRIGTTGTGQGFGRGCDGCNLRGEHRTYSFMIGGGTTQVNGRLPPEAIQRIVRQNFGRMRGCYAAGLARDPKLGEGRIAVKFVIDRSGAVSVAQLHESTITDDAVNSCVVRAYGSLSFPQPEGGIVTVVYPVTFSKD